MRVFPLPIRCLYYRLACQAVRIAVSSPPPLVAPHHHHRSLPHPPGAGGLPGYGHHRHRAAGERALVPCGFLVAQPGWIEGDVDGVSEARSVRSGVSVVRRLRGCFQVGVIEGKYSSQSWRKRLRARSRSSMLTPWGARCLAARAAATSARVISASRIVCPAAGSVMERVQTLPGSTVYRLTRALASRKQALNVWAPVALERSRSEMGLPLSPEICGPLQASHRE